MSNKFVLSYSGGKDCILALYRKIEQGDIPVALLTTVKKSSEETWTHGLSFDLLEQVSKSLELPIIYAQCDVSEYEDVFEEKLREAKKMGATSVVYGDIDIAHHKQWGIDRSKNAGLDYEFPLWQEDREKLEIEKQAERLMEEAKKRGQDPMKFALHQQEILRYMEKNSDELVSFEDYEDLSPEEKYEIERQLHIEKQLADGVHPDEVDDHVP